MQGLYRALYTRCENGVNFYGVPNSKTEQKIFATGGSMDLSSDVLSLLIPEIETALGKDIYNAGLRSYLGDACHYFNCNGVSVMVYYRWLKQEETGQREFGITKALIGNFERHPIEYLSSEFFNGSDFFHKYNDADNKPITIYKQLLTFTGPKFPQVFNHIPHNTLFQMSDSYPVIDFENAGDYVKQSSHIADKIRAAVCHLVKQYSVSDESKRQAIVIRGTREHIRYWIAAIGYAFSIKAAKNISFSLALPPTGYTYSFSNAALVGWDVDDSTVMVQQSLPANLVFLENLPPSESSEYYQLTTSFGKEHFSFINEFAINTDNIKDHPKKYQEYCEYLSFCKVLINFSEGQKQEIDTSDLYNKAKKYSHHLFSDHYNLMLDVITKYVSQSSLIKNSIDIDNIFKILDLVESMIENKVVDDCNSTIEKIHEEFQQTYIHCLKRIFYFILSNSYPFCNSEITKNPKDYFDIVMKRNLDCAYEIANYLLRNEVANKYTFNMNSSDFSFALYDDASSLKYLDNVIYPRINFICFIMAWCKQTITDSILQYGCKAFNSMLVLKISIMNNVDANNHENAPKSRELNVASRKYLYNGVFNPFLKSEKSLNYFAWYERYSKCSYAPQNIAISYFKEQLQKVFLYDFKNIISSNNATIDQRIQYAKKVVNECVFYGINETTLVLLYMENVEFDNRESVFYYDYSFTIFGSNMQLILITRLLELILNSLFPDGISTSKIYTNKSDEYLRIILILLEKLHNFDIIAWKEYCHKVDDQLNELFNFQNWENIIIDDKKQIKLFVDYCLKNDNIWPTVLMISLYQLIFKAKNQKDDLISAKLKLFIDYVEILHNCKNSYKIALVRLVIRNRWTGLFYLRFLQLFKTSSVVVNDVLNTMIGIITPFGDSTFCDFCNEIYVEYLENNTSNVEIISEVKKFYYKISITNPGLFNKLSKEFANYSQKKPEIEEMKKLIEPSQPTLDATNTESSEWGKKENNTFHDNSLQNLFAVEDKTVQYNPTQHNLITPTEHTIHGLYSPGRQKKPKGYCRKCRGNREYDNRSRCVICKKKIRDDLKIP